MCCCTCSKGSVEIPKKIDPIESVKHFDSLTIKTDEIAREEIRIAYSTKPSIRRMSAMDELSPSHKKEDR